MPTILFTWELGGGAGHCVNMLPLVERLMARGHRVAVAARDVVTAQQVLGTTGAEIYQAPYHSGRPIPTRGDGYSFANILYHTGFDSVVTVSALVSAWQRLFALIEPDVILCEHAPTALLASQPTTARKALLGVGFNVPPDVSPLPDLRSGQQQPNPVEDHVCGVVNRMIARWGAAPLQHLAELFTRVDENYLITFPELDQYGNRQSPKYYGVWSRPGGVQVDWPQESSRRIFAYLKPSSQRWSLVSVIELLNELPASSLIYSPEIDERAAELASPRVLLTQNAVDLRSLREGCDLAITNGNSGTTSTLLLKGIPQLHLPLVLEQEWTGRRLESLGAGRMADHRNPAQVALRLMELLQTTSYRESAAAFADRYRDFNAIDSVHTIADSIDALTSVH